MVLRFISTCTVGKSVASPHNRRRMTDMTSFFSPRPPPPNNQQLILLGIQHMAAGRMREAEQCFRLVQQTDPNPTTHFLIATMLPPIYQSLDEINAWRKRFIEQ